MIGINFREKESDHRWETYDENKKEQNQWQTPD